MIKKKSHFNLFYFLNWILFFKVESRNIALSRISDSNSKNTQNSLHSEENFDEKNWNQNQKNIPQKEIIQILSTYAERIYSKLGIKKQELFSMKFKSSLKLVKQ
jgi:hypothetical protein